MAVEKGAESNFNIPQGQRVYLRLNDHEYTMQVGGLIYNAFLQPPGFGGKAQFYTSRDEFTNLSGEQDFNQILAAAPSYNEAAVKDLADRMQRQLEKLDVDSSGAAPVDGDRWVMDPNQHFLQNSLDAIFLILGVMGGLALTLVLLTISNTFRNKGRVILTQLTLVGSGLIFMMIMSVQDSVAYTFGDVLFSVLRFNVNLQFEEPERIQEVEGLMRAYPGVKNVEMWGLTTAKIRPVGQPESNADPSADVLGVPLPTNLYGPQLRLGRWLTPADANAVVLNQKLAGQVGVTVGDWVTFDFGSHDEAKWQVVGLIFDPIITTSANVPRQVLLQVTDSVNKASTVWIQTERTDAAGEAEMAKRLRAYFDTHELKLNPQGTFAGQDTASAATTQIVSNFSIIVKMLAAMAVIIALVGSIALSGVLSLNVRERTREIGVIRAIGASSWAITRLFIGEGLILGLLSWLIALPLSVPAGYLMVQALGAALNSEIVFHYTLVGALYWLAIITVLAVAASWLPAQGATRVSVRESLAYQ